MGELDTIYIPKRVSRLLRGIYTNRVTVLCAQNGIGKSTLVKEFIRRTRPSGISVRFIGSAENTGDCFSQIMSHLLGEPADEPLTDSEYTALHERLKTVSPEREPLIIVDCLFAIQTLLGNRRSADLFSECGCARFVFIGDSMKSAYRKLAVKLDFLLAERPQLCMNISEIKEYAERVGADVNAAAVFSACRGSFLGTRLCFMLAMQGERFSNSTTEERLISAVLNHMPKKTWVALIAAATFPELPEGFCIDMNAFASITAYFGRDISERDGILREMDGINERIPLVSVNHRSRLVEIHPVLKRAAYIIFFRLPKNVQHDLRICFAREYQRRGEAFVCFCEYYLAGEYDLAGAVRAYDRIPYSMMIRSSRLLLDFVKNCPLETKGILPRLLRMLALLMHTDVKPLLSGRFSEVISFIKTDPELDESDRRSLLCYAYALRTNEDFYILDKMGADIMRAYDLFKNTRRFESPMFPWSMYSPSIFALVHRRGYSLQTENSQFNRYQRMYAEMLNHGKYTQNIFAGEARYYQGDLSGALEQLTSAARSCNGLPATQLCALYNAAKCCLFLGSYLRFFELLSQIHAIERQNLNKEEGAFAKLCLGMLRTMRGGGIEDSWFALCTEEDDVMYNRYTAPYFCMTKSAFWLSRGNYTQLAKVSDEYITAAATAGNEIAGIKMRLYCAQAFLMLSRFDRAAQLFSDAMYSAEDNHIPTVPAEICAAFPEVFEHIKPLVPGELIPAIETAQRQGAQFRRGMESVRTYEITYLANARKENYAEHYLKPLEKLTAVTESRRLELGLTPAAYSYAIMAASGISNSEISNLFGVSIDSVKSSLKRTCAAVGASSRRELADHLPTLK